MNPVSEAGDFPFRARSRGALILALAMACLFGSLPVFSQGSTGQIQGGVFDQTGGAIAGAKVAITDVARGVTRNLVTDDAGQYVAPALNAGTYTVKAEAAGFSALERQNVVVQVGQNVRVDLILSPGTQTQTVTVTEEVPAIDTTSATLGGAVSNQAIVSLPLNGRNFFRLLELRPGVVTQPGASTGSSSSNGRRLGADVLLVEGITQFDMSTSNNLINGSGKGAGGDASNMLPLDAVQEFNTQQNPPAEYGWRDGSVVNVGVKSGTNSLRGSAYAFGRYAKATDAKNFFTGTVTPAEMEQFGGTVGGHIIKDKLFWFGAYEGLRISVNSINTVTFASSVSLGGNTALSWVDACNAVGRNNVNPLSAQLAGLPPGSCTPQPASQTFENVFPYNPTTNTSFQPNTTSKQPLNNGLGKLDYNLNDKNHISFFYYDSEAISHSGGAVQPYWTSKGTSVTREYAGGWTLTASSSVVNDVRMGWAGALGASDPGDVDRLPMNPWPKGYSMNTGVTNPVYGGFPSITFNSIASLGVGGRTGRRGPQGQFNFRDTVSYLRGNHAFKFGFEHVWVKFDDNSTQSTWGNIAFTDLISFLTGSPTSGSIVAGDTNENLRARWYSVFLQDTWRLTPRITLTPGLRYEYMGPPHSISNDLGTFDPTVPGGVTQVGPGLAHSKLYSPEKALFLPRIGIAWDIGGNGKTVLRAAVGKLASIPPISAIAQAVPFAATLQNGSTIVVDRRNSGLQSFQNLNFTGAQLAAGWNLTGPIFPITTAGAGGPVCSNTAPCSTGAMDPHYKRPKTIQWNVDIQRAINNRLTVDIAYVGNHGYDEARNIDLNAVPVGTGYNGVRTDGQTVLAACLNAANGCPIPGGSATSSQALSRNAMAAAIKAARPFNAVFPYYDYIVRSTSGFWSNYNALQVTTDLRAFHGLSFLTAYTYSHALDMWTKSSAGVTMPADPNNPFAQYASSDQDVRHRFRFSPTWQIPGRKGFGQALEGWSISGLLAIQGRFPWDPRDPSRVDYAGTGENFNAFNPSPNNGTMMYWNYQGPVDAFNLDRNSNTMPCYGSISGCTPMSFTSPISDPALSAIQQACISAAQAPYQGNPVQMTLAIRALTNTACYMKNGGILTPPAYGTVGNSGRNAFRGDRFNNVDLSLTKNWHVGERYTAQFRIETFNLFNHPTLALPGATPSGVTNGKFGTSTTTADSGNAVVGSGGPRHLQFGLKLTF